jgi:hypothetical protein
LRSDEVVVDDGVVAAEEEVGATLEGSLPLTSRARDVNKIRLGELVA